MGGVWYDSYEMSFFGLYPSLKTCGGVLPSRDEYTNCFTGFVYSYPLVIHLLIIVIQIFVLIYTLF